MVTPDADPKYDPRNMKKAQGNTWTVYRRLLAYAFAYKFRLAVSIIFAILVAASISSMVLFGGAVVNLVFWSPDMPEEGVAERASQQNQDPKEGIVSGAAEWDAFLGDTFGWADSGIAVRAEQTIEAMRTSPMEALQILAVVLVTLALISGVARFLQEYLAGSIGANISVTVAREMFDNVVHLSMDFHEKRSTGEILARFTNDVFMINRGIASVLVKVLREPIKAVFFLILALKISVGLTLIGLCVLPPVALVLIRVGKKIKKSVRRSLEKIASMATVANETFNGIAIIKGYGMEGYEQARVKTELGKLKRHLLKMVKAGAIVGPLTEFIMVLGMVAFILVSGKQVVDGNMSAVDLGKLYILLALMLDPVRKLSSVNNMIQTSVASAERVFEFMDAQPAVAEAPKAKALAPIANTLAFEDVHFSYDGKVEVLKGIDLAIEHGEMVAVVGFSGCGKSTMTKLLPRFYDVSDGRITVDGVDIREATFKSLREQIGIVPQDTILFNMSVRENIAFGKSDFTDEAIVAAAKAAHAHGFIEKLPQGYDTVINEGGSSLSGGQRQRLAIARALIKDPAILVLDEATSHLDSESEREIQKALGEFVVGRTTIVIAHRLATVKQAARILVLDEGRIAEMGTHQELLSKGGIYRRLYDTQFAPEDEEA
jgi:subfamily B ATP-binding cassette protein MsbA